MSSRPRAWARARLFSSVVSLSKSMRPIKSLLPQRISEPMTISEANSDKPKILVNDLNLWYADFQALKGIFASFQEKKITAIIGPSGCGKSTLLRVFNRMNDLIEGVRTSGEAFIDGLNIIDAVASGRKNQG